jgi:type II secretory ATPase GspE/PulE/Tfp pilus assembly ATPase PilB-like protein
VEQEEKGAGRRATDDSDERLGFVNNYPPSPHRSEEHRSRALLYPASAQELALCSTEQARDLVPIDKASSLNVLPLSVADEGDRRVFTAACVESNVSRDTSSALRFLTGCDEVRLHSVRGELVPLAVAIAYHRDDRPISRAMSALRVQGGDAQGTDQGLPFDFRRSGGDAAQLLSLLVDYALARGASDLHLTPTREGAYVRLRINNELMTQREPNCPKAIHQQIVRRLKVVAGLDLSVHDRPQEGMFELSFGGGTSGVRLTIMPTLHGECVALRLLSNVGERTLEQIGLPTRIAGHLQKILQRKSGLVLFSGPTGAGKTTTLYAALRRMSGSGLHIVSIEDPPEGTLENVTQIALSSRAGFDYPKALRSVLRHDPDVILVGEIRDSETARAAHEGALTGHLILSTVHANGAVEVLNRLSVLGMTREKIAEVVRLIVFQRLIPALCNVCKVVDLASSKQFGESIYQRVGCDRCGYSGYDGRVLLAESLVVNRSLREVLARPDLNECDLREAVFDGEYEPLLESLRVGFCKGAIDRISFEQMLEELD